MTTPEDALPPGRYPLGADGPALYTADQMRAYAERWMPELADMHDSVRTLFIGQPGRSFEDACEAALIGVCYMVGIHGVSIPDNAPAVASRAQPAPDALRPTQPGRVAVDEAMVERGFHASPNETVTRRQVRDILTAALGGVEGMTAAHAHALLAELAAKDAKLSLWARIADNAECALANADAAIVKLESELAGLREDAERYRWLRERETDAPRFPILCPDSIPGCRYNHTAPCTGQALDAAIDAARRGE